MQKLNFTCTFKSDIVLHGSSNTEGKIEKLDYIPGSNFLGMVARGYAGFEADAFSVFHSGEVCFGDGHILHHDVEPTFAMPFSFQAYKGVSFEEAIKDKKLFVHHYLEQEDFDCATSLETQLKQQRVGFITKSGNLATLEHSYKQKSAYDKKKRRSKDSTMFGYHALPAKSRWAFAVTMTDAMADKYKDKIKELLIGDKRLGKSKSAEYGLVNIEYLDDELSALSPVETQIIAHEPGKKYLYLYAKSRLVLTDENGVNSYMPSKESLGFDATDDVSIDWSKSQIRTSRYTPYVGARRNFDPERLVIDKGSVIVVDVTKAKSLDVFIKNIQTPIGLYISEGHGEVIVNPSWLSNKKVVFESMQNNTSSNNTTQNVNYDNPTNNWLSSQREAKENEGKIFDDVITFIEDKDNNVQGKKSQWGQIRSLCRQAKNSNDLYGLLFEKDNNKGFLRHGRGLEKWDSKLIENLEKLKDIQEDNYKQFVTLLSIYAPKEDDKGGEDE